MKINTFFVSKTSSKAVLFFLVLTSVFTAILAITSCGSEPPEETEKYSADVMIADLEEHLMNGEESFSLCFLSDSDTENEIQSFIDGHASESYLASCLLDDITAEFRNHSSCIDVDLTLTYKSNVQFDGKMQQVSDGTELENAMIKRFSASTGKAAFILESCSFAEDELIAILNSAEINCASVPCEADNVSYMTFDPRDDRQLLIAWVELPINDTMLKEKDAEMQKKTDKIINSLNDSDTGSVSDTCEAVMEHILSCTEYDDDLASATIAGSRRLTSDMHIDRSSYGSIVTGRTVCTGYARAYKLFCDELGLSCRVITGTKNGVRHAWNAVEIENETFYVDCTAADTGTPKASAFLITRSQAESSGYVFDDHYKN